MYSALEGHHKQDKRNDESFENYLKEAEEMTENLGTQPYFAEEYAIKLQKKKTILDWESEHERLSDLKQKFKVFSVLNTIIALVEERNDQPGSQNNAFYILKILEQIQLRIVKI